MNEAAVPSAADAADAACTACRPPPQRLRPPCGLHACRPAVQPVRSGGGSACGRCWAHDDVMRPRTRRGGAGRGGLPQVPARRAAVQAEPAAQASRSVACRCPGARAQRVRGAEHTWGAMARQCPRCPSLGLQGPASATLAQNYATHLPLAHQGLLARAPPQRRPPLDWRPQLGPRSGASDLEAIRRSGPHRQVGTGGGAGGARERPGSAPLAAAHLQPLTCTAARRAQTVPHEALGGWGGRVRAQGPSPLGVSSCG